MTEPIGVGQLAIRVSRPDPRVAVVEATSPGHREFFFIAAGERMLTVAAFEASDSAHPEPRVHMIHRPYDWDMAPVDDPASAADDQELLVKIWQILGAG